MSRDLPQHITHLFSPVRIGGLERVVEMLAIGQLQRGHSVSAIAIVQPGVEPPVIHELRHAGVPVQTVDAAGRAYHVERASFARALAERPKGVLHTHGYRADVLHSPVAAEMGFARVSTLHGFTGGDWKMRFYEYLQIRAVRKFERVVAVSRPIVDRMRKAGVAADRLCLVPNAYRAAANLASRSDARARLGITGDRYTVAYVGRMSREKGADVLIDAFARLRDLPISLVCVGEGPEVPVLRERVHTLGIADMIQWVDPVDGVSSLFRAFDLFALGSRTEGTPIVLFEAATANVPIVSTAVGGIPDVFTPHQALLVPPESPDALADAIRQSFSEPAAARERAARAAAVVADRFAPAPWVARYDDVYADAIGVRRAAS